MTTVLDTTGLSKHFGRKWALRDCTLSVPEGRVVGLVGPNGAGKSTLLHLAVGLLAPDAGTISVLGGRPAEDQQALARIGFLAQDSPAYDGLTVKQHLQMGQWLNPGWDDEFASRRINELELDRRQRAGSLSGGQRAQLALTLAVAKRPELLILDEPVASLDPLARREFMQTLMEIVAGGGVTVVMSSHLVADLERVCDYFIVLTDSRVAYADNVEDMLASHRRLIGPRRDTSSLPGDIVVVEESHTDKQSNLVVRGGGSFLDPAWTTAPVTLDDIVLAYMKRARDDRSTGGPHLQVAG
jgi:ABC-2 type transport system ATP-binding protein